MASNPHQISANSYKNNSVFHHGKARPWLLWLLLALALGVGGGFWWWQQRSASAQPGATKSPSGPPGPPGPPGMRGGPGGPGGFGGPGGPGGAQPVTAGQVLRRDMPVIVGAIGHVQAQATAVVRTKVGGELKALRFSEGQEVRAGQLLAEIDRRSLQASFDQMGAALARDQALLKNAQLDLQRYQALQAQDAIARQEVDTQAALVGQYEANIAAAKAQLAQARVQLDDTRILAPISGRLGLRAADVGNVVNPSDAAGIVTITQVRPIDAVFALAEVHLPLLRAQLQKGRALPVELWNRDNTERLARGEVSALDNSIDSATGTLKVKARFANAEGALFPNQFVNVRLQLDVQEQVLTVPMAAVQNGRVYRVKDDGTIQQQRVSAGVSDGQRVALRLPEGSRPEDLPEGAQVVTDGIDRLRDGAKVKVIDPQAAQAAQATPSAGSDKPAAGSRPSRAPSPTNPPSPAKP